MCQQIRFALTRDRERLRTARCLAATYGGIGAAWLEASPRQSRRHNREAIAATAWGSWSRASAYITLPLHK